MLSRTLITLSVVAGVLIASPVHASEDDCDGLDYEGRCDGDLVRWCEEGTLRVTDCAEQGTTCAHDAERGYYACISPERAPDHGCPDGLSWHGRCDGERVVWCEQGTERSLKCAEGTRCGWSDEGTYDCLVEGEGGGQSFGAGGGAAEDDGGAAPGHEPEDPAEPAPKSTGGKPPVGPEPSTEGGTVDAPAPTDEPAPADAAIGPATGCRATGAAPGGLLAVLAALALAALPRRRLR